MVRYFIGNVLSPWEKEHKAENDHTFAFSKQEANDLKLVGKPIRMEHDASMEVGTITRDWVGDDGTKWVVGRLNNDTFESKFANYAIEKNPETGDCYYTGLSLQHTHTQFANKGKTTKEAIEVSLCVNPRRDDCRICFVSSGNILNEAQTKKVVYKIHSASLQSNMAEQNTVTETTPQQESTETVVEKTAPVAETVQETKPATEMTREDMMKVIVEQQKELEQATSNKSAELKELEALKEQMEAAKAEELKKDKEKAFALSKALIDQWAETLDKTEMDEESRESVLKMARDFPRESMAMLKVAHCASAKHKATRSQFEDYKEVMKRSQLQEKFEAVMSKKRPAPQQVVHQEVHAASTKKQRTAAPASQPNNVQQFISAMSKYRSSGSARDHMTEVSKIGVRRNVGGRAPYY